MSDSPDYLSKKKFFDSLLTVYGRKPVLEALQDNTLNIYCVHLADSNRSGGIIQQITEIAEQREVPIKWHERKGLSRISRNSKQDQGVAADIQLEQHQSLEDFVDSDRKKPFRLIALDRITNPQNLGMIIRSVCAGYIDGVILPEKGCAALSPLVIKASVGTLFKTRVLRCENLKKGLSLLQQRNTLICTLSSHAKASLLEFKTDKNTVYVLGNETEGVSDEIIALSDQQLCIPMNNGVESLNVAVTAALIAFQQ